MSTTATFEQRATAAGASLRAAFYEGDPVTTPTTHRPPSVEQPQRRGPRGRVLLAAAAAVVAVATAAAVVLSGDDDDRALPPAQEPQSSESVLTGLRDLPDYPIRLTMPAGMFEVDEDAGSRAFRPLSKPAGGVVVTALRSVNGTAATALPADVTTLLSTRADVVVSDKGTTTVGGRPAQSFTLTVAPGAQPRDLWCPVSEPLCFKLDTRLTAEVLVVPSSAGPLWISVEHDESSRTEVQRLAEQLISSIELP